MENPLKKSKFKLIGRIFVVLLSISIIFIFSIHFYIENTTKTFIKPEENIIQENSGKYEAIMVLGSGIVNNLPTPILRERLDTGINLYKNGVAPKILMTGDNGSIHYDEVSVMRRYAIDKGVPSDDIFMDYAGFSTYESIYRAQYIFGIRKMIIVTQRYHLFRSIYIAKAFNIDVVGANATKGILTGHTSRVCREVIAQNKDFLTTIFKPYPKFLGEKISLEQSADDVYK